MIRSGGNESRVAREFLQIVIESAYGVPKASPTAGTEKINVRLSGGNAFTIIGDPVWFEVMYGGGEATPAFADTDQFECTGQLTTEFYGSQAKFFSDWFGQKINAGQTTPWTTTEPPGDLPSCSVYHAVQRSDGTYKRIRFPGTKVETWAIECSREQKYAKLTLGLRSQKWVGNPYDASSDPTSTEFPAPADTDYPTDVFKFIDLKGNLTIDSSRTAFSSIALKAVNKLDAQWFEDRFLYLLRRLGRSSTLDASVLYKPTPDDLASYQALTALATSIRFDNGVNFFQCSMNAQNKLKKVGKSLEVDRVYQLPLSLQNYWDPVAGTDLTITAGAVTP